MSVFRNEKYTTTKGGNLIRRALMHTYRLTSKCACHSLSKTGWFFSPSLHFCQIAVPPWAKKYRQYTEKNEGIENRGFSFSFTHPPLLTPPSLAPWSQASLSPRTHGECLEALFIFCLHNAFLQALYLCQSPLWSGSAYPLGSCEWKNPPVRQQPGLWILGKVYRQLIWLNYFFTWQTTYVRWSWLVADSLTSGLDILHRWFYLLRESLFILFSLRPFFLAWVFFCVCVGER